MPTTARPDTLAYMDAYTLLGVEYSADSSQIRRAYRQLARCHHPDRYSAGSAEQQQAAARMTSINATDAELDQAIHQARVNRNVDLGLTAACAAVMIVLVPMLAPSLASALPLTLRAPVVIGMGLASSVGLFMLLGPRAWHVLYKIQLALAILHVLKDRFS